MRDASHLQTVSVSRPLLRSRHQTRFTAYPSFYHVHCFPLPYLAQSSSITIIKMVCTTLMARALSLHCLIVIRHWRDSKLFPYNSTLSYTAAQLSRHRKLLPHHIITYSIYNNGVAHGPLCLLIL